jgi:Winged helix-turn helix
VRHPSRGRLDISRIATVRRPPLPAAFARTLRKLTLDSRPHTWKLLRRRLHYRLQRPARRAIERDERAIARWVAEDWP